MNLEYKSLLPVDFPSQSRVWVYQCSRMLGLSEALDVEANLNEFLAGWTAHGAPVKGWGSLFFGQFIILMADESSTHVSGCSTDASVHFIQALEKVLGVPLMDRQLLAFIIRDTVQLLPLSQIPHALQHGFIGPDTLYFNNMITDKVGLENNWLIPVKESWLASRYALS